MAHGERARIMGAEAVRAYATEHREAGAREAPTPKECEAAYTWLTTLGLLDLRDAASPDDFWVAAGRALGEIHYFDAAGQRVLSEDDADAIAVFAEFQPLPIETVVGRWIRLVGRRTNGAAALLEHDALALYAALFACVRAGADPTHDPTYVALVRELADAELIREDVQSVQGAGALGRAAADNVNVLQLASYENPEPEPAPEEVRGAVSPAWLTRVAGDGACLYRSFAVGMLYALLGFNFAADGGSAFGLAFIDGDPDAWATAGETLDNAIAVPRLFATEGHGRGAPGEWLMATKDVLLNVLTMWIKFYVYLVLCTDIPTEHISYTRGVEHTPGVHTMTTIAELQAPLAIEAVLGRAGDGMWHVPSLDLVVRYVGALYADLTFGPSAAAALDWPTLKPAFDPLMALQWGNPRSPFRVPAAIPDKRFWQYDPFTRSVAGHVTLYQVLPSSPDFDAVAAGVADEKSAYALYCASMRQFQSFGGEGEAAALTNVLLRSALRGAAEEPQAAPPRQRQRAAAPPPFRAAILYRPRDADTFATDGLVVPWTNSATESDTSDDLRALFTVNHYDAILSNAVAPLPFVYDAILGVATRNGSDPYVPLVETIANNALVRSLAGLSLTSTRGPCQPSVMAPTTPAVHAQSAFVPW